MTTTRSIRWLRVLGAGLFAEVVPLLLLLVVASVYGMLAHGVSEEDIGRFAARAGDWIGPLGGAVATLLAARWAASRTTKPVLHGLLVGALALVLGVTILVVVGASFRAIFVASYVGKLGAGALGGRLAIAALR